MRRQLLGPAGERAIGDAVVPAECAELPGARLIALEGVFHSISKVGTWEDEDTSQQWYGSDAVVDEWADALLAGVRSGGGRDEPGR